MKKTESAPILSALEASTSRRKFIQYSGSTLVATGLLLAGCTDDEGMLIDIKAPTNLTAVQNEVGDVLLTWKNNAANVEGLVVQRSSSVSGTFEQIGEKLPPQTTTYTDYAATLPTAGAVYYYRVSAYIGKQSSASTAVVDSMGGGVLIHAGSGDIGVLNYLYALKQVAVAFYTMAVSNEKFGAIFPLAEQQILKDILQHETAHSAFYKTLLGTQAIPEIQQPDFSMVDFGLRERILPTAKTLENISVAAYNGAGQLFVNREYLQLIVKIVSVEARHAATISSMLNPGTNDFLSSADIEGRDPASLPESVLKAVNPYLVNRLDIQGLPVVPAE